MTESPADVIVDLRRRGIRLWAENHELRYQAADSLLTAEDLARLRAAKVALLAYLESQPRGPQLQGRIPRRMPSDLVPLSFAQQWHWHRWQSWRGSFRMQCAFTHISGDLDIIALRKSLIDLCRRHEVLTTRVVTRDGMLLQEFLNPDTCPFATVDLSDVLIDDLDTAIRRHVSLLFCRRVDPSMGPAFEVLLIKLRATEHLFLSVVDHLVCDAISRVLLLSDLWTIYAQCTGGLQRPLPERSRFSDFAVWQYRNQASWASIHASYWTERLAGARRLEVLQRGVASASKPFRIGSSQVFVGHDCRAGLLWLSRHQQSTLAMACLTAYVALLSRWCRTTDLVIPFLTTGRFIQEIQYSVGNFAFPLFLRLGLRENDDFVDLLRRVTSEYSRAQEHCDFGSIARQSCGSAILKNPEVNCVPAEFQLSRTNDLDHSSVDGLGGLRLRPFAIELSDQEAGLRGDWGPHDWDYEPAIRFSDGDGAIIVSLLYASDDVTTGMVERFLRNVRIFLEAMAACPRTRVSTLELV